ASKSAGPSLLVLEVSTAMICPIDVAGGHCPAENPSGECTMPSSCWKPAMSPVNRETVIGVLSIVAVAVLVYGYSLRGGFLLDDDVLLTDNELVKSPDGLYRIWLTSEPVDYWPVTNTSFWIEWRLWGENPLPYRVTNLGLHIINSLLIWLV